MEQLLPCKHVSATLEMLWGFLRVLVQISSFGLFCQISLYFESRLGNMYFKKITKFKPGLNLEIIL